MTDPSVAQPALPSTRKELLADQVEAELRRLYAARPELSDRLDRAAGILLLQLSCHPRTRPIRCRISPSGLRFLVNSSSTRGATYVINPRFWTCTCPDHHRTGKKGCKHALAAWVLWKIGTEPRPCACIDGWVYISHTELVNADTGEVVESVDRIPCRRCRGPVE